MHRAWDRQGGHYWRAVTGGLGMAWLGSVSMKATTREIVSLITLTTITGTATIDPADTVTMVGPVTDSPWQPIRAFSGLCGAGDKLRFGSLNRSAVSAC